LLEVGAEAKGRASWKRISVLPLRRVHSGGVGVLVYGAGSAHWHRLHSRVELVDEEEIDVDAFEGMVPEDVPFDGNEEEGLVVGVLRVTTKRARASTCARRAARTSHLQHLPSSRSSRRAYIMFGAAREQDPGLAQLPSAMRPKKLGEIWCVMSAAEKVGGAGAINDTDRTSEEARRAEAVALKPS
jgi:hypothetical protein